MRFHHDWCTRGKLIFTNRFLKGIWHRKFKSHTVNYDIMIIVTLNKMSLSSSSGKKIKFLRQPFAALVLQKLAINRINLNLQNISGTASNFWHCLIFSCSQFFVTDTNIIFDLKIVKVVK